MIKGTAGRKPVSHAEMIFVSPRLRKETILQSGRREYHTAIRSIESSYVTGLKNLNRYEMRLANARTDSAKKEAQRQVTIASDMLTQLEARRAKIIALAKKMSK